jgi:cyclopropane fatty-acyl-phospholipid synthase-like methyltransferase
VLNVDVLAFHPDEPYDLIVSVSTLEHVGWDDDERDPAKIPLAIDHLRSLLAPGGRAIVTLPLGYNPWLDKMLEEDTVAFDAEDWFQRVGRTRWHEVTRGNIERPSYGAPYLGANGLVIGIVERAG